MDATQLENEKTALEQELETAGQKADRLEKIRLCLADIAKVEQGEALVKNDKIISFYFKKGKQGLQVDLWQSNGQKVSFETERPDEYLRDTATTLNCEVPAGMSDMQEMLLGVLAVVKDRLQLRIDKLLTV